jgi:hypothetical protein
MSWKGMYIPELNVPIDLDKSGTFDVIFLYFGCRARSRENF